MNSVCCNWDEISRAVNHMKNLKHGNWENPYLIAWVIVKRKQQMITGKSMHIYLHRKMHFSCTNRSGLSKYIFSSFFKELLILWKIIGGINLVFVQTILCSFSVVFCLFNYKDHLHENRILRLERLLMPFPRYME